MKYKLYILILILTPTSCKKETNKTFSEKKHETVLVEKIENTDILQTNSINEIWNELIFKKGGCLVGSQYITKKKIKKEGSVFNKSYWIDFLNRPKLKTTNFLISKFSDTTKTKIHTCPFYGATNGEIAVYTLQQIHKINWYDFIEFKKYSQKKIVNATDQPQIWLRKILESETDRNKLAKLFQNELKN